MGKFSILTEKIQKQFFYSRETLDKVLMRKISFTDTMLEDFLSTYGKKYQI